MRYRCYAKYHQVVSSNWFSTYARTSISTTWAFDEASQWANTWFNNLLNFHSRDSISLARVIIHSSVVLLLLLSFLCASLLVLFNVLWQRKWNKNAYKWRIWVLVCCTIKNLWFTKVVRSIWIRARLRRPNQRRKNMNSKWAQKKKSE